VRQFSFSADGNRVLAVTATSAVVVNLYDPTSPQETFWHRGTINDAQFSPDGSMVVTASADKTARIWNAARPAMAPLPVAPQQGCTSAAFADGGSTILVASDQDLLTYDSDSLIDSNLEHFEGKLTSLTTDSTGKKVLVGFEDGHLETPFHQRVSDEVNSYAPVFSHDGKYFATIGGFREKLLVTMRENEQFCVWETKTRARLTRPDSIAPVAPFTSIRALAFGSSPSELLTALSSGEVLPWTILPNGAVQAGTPVLRHPSDLRTITVSNDGLRLAFAGYDGTLAIRSLGGDKSEVPLAANSARIICLAFDRKTRLLAAGYADGSLVIYGVLSGNAILRLACPAEVLRVEF